MEKYWALDLDFIKAELRTTFRCRNSVLYSKYKYFNIYKINEYIESKVIDKKNRCDTYEADGTPYKYLKLTKRFIIPSEIILTQEYLGYKSSDSGKLLERTELKSIMRYTVNEKELYLEPLEIIYYNYDLKRPYLNIFGNCFYGLDYRVLIMYDRNADKYKYYTVNNYNQIENYNLHGVEAKNRIERELLKYRIGRIWVTPVLHFELSNSF